MTTPQPARRKLFWTNLGSNTASELRFKIDFNFCDKLLPNSTFTETIPGGEYPDNQGIQKRQAPPDLLALWQAPLFYKACALVSGLDLKATKAIKIPWSLALGPFGKITGPLLPGALITKLLLGICPPASVLAWYLASGINPAPGV